MRPSHWWLIVPVLLLAGLYALVARDMYGSHTIRSHVPTRAEKLAKSDPLVVLNDVDHGNRVKVIRAVVGGTDGTCYAIAFRELAGVWFYDSQVPCSQLP